MKFPLSQIRLPEKDLRASIDQEALEELADSMRLRGQLQPIGIRQLAADAYEVVYGARRYRAAQLNNWTDINAEITDDAGDGSTAADKLIENVQRQDLTPIEEAYGLLDLIGEGEANVMLLQRQTGKSREWIRGRLALIDLPEDIQGAVQAGVIGIGVAKALGAIANPDVREQYVKHAVENGCTTEQAAIWAGQAQYAETGIMTMQNMPDRNEQITNGGGPVEQNYQCFNCNQSKTWRQAISVILCTTCHERVASNRTTSQARQ